MQLAKGERSLLAYFPTSDLARAAADALEQAGYQHVQVDRISRYGVNQDAELDQALVGPKTITGLTLYSSGTEGLDDQDESVLKAADPSVSGYGNHDYGLAGGQAFLLTIVTDEKQVAQAESIIGQHQGRL